MKSVWRQAGDSVLLGCGHVIEGIVVIPTLMREGGSAWCHLCKSYAEIVVIQYGR